MEWAHVFQYGIFSRINSWKKRRAETPSLLKKISTDPMYFWRPKVIKLFVLKFANISVCPLINPQILYCRVFQSGQYRPPTIDGIILLLLLLLFVVLLAKIILNYFHLITVWGSMNNLKLHEIVELKRLGTHTLQVRAQVLG